MSAPAPAHGAAILEILNERILTSKAVYEYQLTLQTPLRPVAG